MQAQCATWLLKIHSILAVPAQEKIIIEKNLSKMKCLWVNTASAAT